MSRNNSHPVRSQKTPDVLVHNEGTIFLFNPLTAEAKRWMEANVHPDSHWFGTTLAGSRWHVLPCFRCKALRTARKWQGGSNASLRPSE